MTTKATIIARNRPKSLALMRGRRHGQGPVLSLMPTCANLSFSRPVIRWMSAKMPVCAKLGLDSLVIRSIQTQLGCMGFRR
jgi:hypothetical protein